MPRMDALLRQARTRIDGADAELLLAHLLQRPRGWLYAHGDDSIDDGLAARFADLLARREAGEPLAYLTGRSGFWRFELMVTPATLIPRPETELLVELALARLPVPAKGTPPSSVPAITASCAIADLGTGSGAIALALASERPHARVVATDASLDALQVARANAQALGLDRIEFRHGNWLAPLASERFDLIASNPPYVAYDDPHLEALRFEPAAALASGHDGLDDIRTIVRDAPSHLQPGGWLLLEHGLAQGEAVRALMAQAGLAEIATRRDLEQRERVTLGRFAL